MIADEVNTRRLYDTVASIPAICYEGVGLCTRMVGKQFLQKNTNPWEWFNFKKGFLNKNSKKVM